MRALIPLLIFNLTLSFVHPANAGRGCQVFHDLSNPEYLNDSRLQHLTKQKCKRGHCTEDEAEEILGEMRRSKKSGQDHFKGADALHRENEQVSSIVNDLRLNREQRRQLHNEITGQHLSREEILMRARDLFDMTSGH
jgi:polyhydroxyalkanoate synthesis regulator phasin